MASILGTGGNDVIKAGTSSGWSGTRSSNGSTIGPASGYLFEEDDTITAGGGNDNVDGGAGKDYVLGGAGNDTLAGGDGNDTLDAGTGTDVLDGGAGTDTATWSTLAGAVTVNLKTGQASDGTNTATLTGIENVLGGSGADVLVGSGVSAAAGGANLLVGNGGDDALYGSGDTVAAGSYTFTLPVGTPGFGVGGAVTVTGAVNFNIGDSLDGADTLQGSAGNDSLYGGYGNDSLDGGDGNDLLVGGAGNDIMRGGGGDDFYVVDHVADQVTGELAGGGIDTVLSSVNFTLGPNVEYLILSGTANINGSGSTGDDVIIGNAGNNILNGSAGADYLWGGDGNDNLTGGVKVGTSLDSVDTLVGGKGNDIYFVGAGDIVVEAAPNMINHDNDTLTAEIDENGIDTVSAGDDYTLAGGVYVERLVTTKTNAKLTGNDIGQTVVGAGGNDTVAGGGGNDSVEGASGNDVLYGGTSLSGASSGDDTLYGGAGQDTLYGGDGNDTYVINDTNIGLGTWVWDRAVETSQTGALGADYDTIMISTLRVTSSDTTAGAAGHAVYDMIADGDSQHLSGYGVENVIITGSGHIDVLGNALDNVLVGNGGFNTLNGRGGNDLLLGGGGADMLIGMAGVDTMYGGQGIDVYQVDDKDDIVREYQYSYTNGVFTELEDSKGNPLDAGGNDRVNLNGDSWEASLNLSGADQADPTKAVYQLGDFIERLAILKGDTFTAHGNDLRNRIENADTNAGKIVMEGLGGADTIVGSHLANDTLAGGDLVDQLRGGLGTDEFRFDSKFYTLNGKQYVNGADRIMDFNHGDITTNGTTQSTTEGDTIAISWQGYGLGTLFPQSQGGPANPPLVYLDYVKVTNPNTGQSIITTQVVDHDGLAVDMGTDPTFVYNRTNGLLQFDLNGSKAGGTTAICYLQQEGTVLFEGTTYKAYADLLNTDIVIF